MGTTEQLDKLYQELENLKNNEQEEVNINSLLDYINSLKEKQPNHDKNDFLIEKLKHESNSSIEMFKSVIQSGQNAMKTALFINAGAAISMLTLISNLIAKDEKVYVSSLSTPLLIFVLGVLMAACAYGTTYFTQSFYSDKNVKYGNISNNVSIGLTIMSLASFGKASFCIYFLFKGIQ